jgi:hypothetical protein
VTRIYSRHRAFESGFAPLGFKQNATNAQAEAAIKPLRDLDSALTAITKEHGLFALISAATRSTVSELKVQARARFSARSSKKERRRGKSNDGADRSYATEWIKAVGARNNLSASEISADIRIWRG